MSAIATPLRPVRKLRFSLDPSAPDALPSPYTPFSGRRSGSMPVGTPQVPAPAAAATTVAAAAAAAALPLDTADDYINGGLDASLRASSLDVLAAVHARFSAIPSAHAAAALSSQLLAAVEAQLALSSELIAAPALHLHARRRVRALHHGLLLEHATWLLVVTAWRPPEILSRDLVTRRLAPHLLDPASVHDVPGYITCQRVVEWLERSADEELERAGGPRVKPLDDPAYRLEYTAAARGKGPVAMDYAQGGGNTLDEVERKAEVRLSREIFRLVRAGRLEEAEEICRKVGQPWRAAALAGGKMGSALAANGIKGQARKTWRMAAKTAARSTTVVMTPHERAVYGVLSGELEPVLAVATSYEDQAWARLSVLLDVTAERVLEGAAPESVEIKGAAILQAFRECEHAGEGSESISGKLLEGLRMVRAFLAITPDISSAHLTELLHTLARLAHRAALEKVEWVSRFAAHICLFLKSTGLLADIDNLSTDRVNFDSTLESYVQLIIEMDLENEKQAAKEGAILPARPIVAETAAVYLAEMTSEDRMIGTYSHLMFAALKADLEHERAEAKRVGVSPRDIDERRTLCLEKAGQCFSRDVLRALMIAAVDLVWESTLPSNTGLPSIELESQASVVDDISETDGLTVRAIEFLLFPAFANYSEALMRVTIAARRFFLQGKHAATRHLIGWFPAEVASQLPPETCVGAKHELESWRVYLDAVARHGEWNVYHSSNKPPPLPQKTRAQALAEPDEVTYEIQANANIQLEKYNKESEEFLRISNRYRDAAVEALKSALLFESGWMYDLHERDAAMGGDVEVDTHRAHQAEEIRRVRCFGIPQLAVLLRHVLHESGMYSEAIGLAQTIADDDTKLYESFGQAELTSFLAQIADSTVLYADAGIRSGELRRPYEDTLLEEIESAD